jgi:hypothetical protein
MRLNRQARQERQEKKRLDLILAFLASLAVQSFLIPFRAAAIKSVFQVNHIILFLCLRLTNPLL